VRVGMEKSVICSISSEEDGEGEQSGIDEGRDED
jgi:hypothetical protein